jgi:hypothetical protein
LISWFLSIASQQDELDKHVGWDPVESEQWDSTFERLADLLVEEANRLHHSIAASPGDSDPAAIIVGTTRIQSLVDEMLAGSAGDRQIALGLPF